MKKREKRTVAIAVLLLLGLFVSYAAWGEGNVPKAIRRAVQTSLEDDFRIKESLGELFFAQKDPGAQSVSSQMTPVSLLTPVEGEMRATADAQGVIFLCRKFDAVLAAADGVIETVEDDRLTLRHADGKLSVYQHIGTLWKAGRSVKRGDTIGYASGQVIYRLYSGSTPVDPQPFFTA